MSLFSYLRALINTGVTPAQIAAATGDDGQIGNVGTTGQQITIRGQQCVRVKVVSNASGGGKYLGPIITSQDAAQVNETSALTEGDFGTITTDTTRYALILNAAEVGVGTHDLTAGTPKTKIFLGYLLPRRSTSDRLVVCITGLDWEACT